MRVESQLPVLYDRDAMRDAFTTSWVIMREGFSKDPEIGDVGQQAWFNAVADAGVSPDAVSAAAMCCLTRLDYFPSLAKFLTACRECQRTLDKQAMEQAQPEPEPEIPEAEAAENTRQNWGQVTSRLRPETKQWLESMGVARAADA